MKISKFNENFDSDVQVFQDISKILDDQLYTEPSYYGDREISGDGKLAAVQEIVKYLKELGVDFELLIQSKKYNI